MKQPDYKENSKMKDIKVKFRLEKWHFYILGLVLLNFGLGLITGYRLNQNLTFILKVILYLTGMFLFFKAIRPFKLMTVYFSFYVFSAVVTGLMFLFGGIFLAVLSSFALYPIYPQQTKYKTETIRIYDRFYGFMGRCFTYEVVEPKLYIFEKHLGYIRIKKPIDANKDEFSFKNNTIVYRHELYDKQTTTVRDTIEILILE